MIVSKEVVEAAYQRYARNYDLAVKFYRLIGVDLSSEMLACAKERTEESDIV